MNLKEHLRQIAINKIEKTQKSSTTVKKDSQARFVKNQKSSTTVEKDSQTRVAKIHTKCKTIKFNSTRKPLAYFPIIAVGAFGYVRPAEARYPSEAVRELSEKIQKDILQQKIARNPRLSAYQTYLKSKK